jgi:hypothetical protein
VILRLIFYILLFGAIYYAVRGLFAGGISGKREEDDPSDDVMIACPECGTYFPGGMGVSCRVRGRKYLFCSEECAQKFNSRGGPPQEENIPS